MSETRNVKRNVTLTPAEWWAVLQSLTLNGDDDIAQKIYYQVSGNH